MLKKMLLWRTMKRSYLNQMIIRNLNYSRARWSTLLQNLAKKTLKGLTCPGNEKHALTRSQSGLTLFSSEFQKPNNCERCATILQSRSLLQMHMKTHQIVPPYQCNDCDKTCKSKAQLKNHVNTSHSEKTAVSNLRQYNCEDCSGDSLAYNWNFWSLWAGWTPPPWPWGTYPCRPSRHWGCPQNKKSG